MDRDTSVILDIQCFKDNNNCFIIKEIAAVNVKSGALLFHHIVSSPYPRMLLSAEKMRESYWLTKHYHGLEWSDGDILYQLMLEKLKTIFTSVSSVFVKGREKSDYLKTILPEECNVIDLETLHCQSLDVITNLFEKETLRCNSHSAIFHKCALSNVVNLRKWYLLTQK
jgi:hypothetical protein